MFRKKEKLKIGFWAGENYFNFVDPIIEFIEKEGLYDVEKFEYFGDINLLKKQLKQCDLAWFEWARGPIEDVSKIDTTIPIICRLHKYEAYIDSPKNIDWEKVSTLLFISEAVKNTFEKRFPDEIKKVKSIIIANGVDTNLFKLNNNKRGYKIVFNGRFHYHKSPELLLQCINAIHKKDKKYEFYLIGGFTDPVIEEYFWYQVDQMKLNPIIHYDGVINDVHNWLQDKDYFLQPSIIEGQSVAALEAMSCGLKPVLHNYYNSYKVFPKKYLFNTIDEAVDMVTNNDYNRDEYRNYVKKYNNIDIQINKINDLIKDLLNEKS